MIALAEANTNQIGNQTKLKSIMNAQNNKFKSTQIALTQGRGGHVKLIPELIPGLIPVNSM